MIHNIIMDDITVELSVSPVFREFRAEASAISAKLVLGAIFRRIFTY